MQHSNKTFTTIACGLSVSSSYRSIDQCGCSRNIYDFYESFGSKTTFFIEHVFATKSEDYCR